MFGTHRRHLNFDVKMFRSDSTGLFFIINSPISVGAREKNVSVRFWRMNILKSIFQATDFMAMAGTKSYRQTLSGEKRRKKSQNMFFWPEDHKFKFCWRFFLVPRGRWRKTSSYMSSTLTFHIFVFSTPDARRGETLTHKHMRSGGRAWKMTHREESGWQVGGGWAGWWNSG